MKTFASNRLRDAVALIVARMGSDDAETALVADHLVRANLAGHDSHGIGMLPIYVKQQRAGLLQVNQTLKLVNDAGALLVFDADHGFGAHMGHEATARAIDRARKTGACAFSLRNSAHIGRIGTYGEQAAAAGMAFTAFVNVSGMAPVSATFAAAAGRLGTNPFVASLPAPGGPLVLDMATTKIAHGKARIAYNKNSQVPPGCLLDSQGRPTTDPSELIEQREGALLTFGEHKGSGLAIMCEMMAGAFGGGRRIDEPVLDGIINSMFAVVTDLEALGGAAKIEADVGATKSYLTSAPRREGGEDILLPGDPERRAAAQREAQGIPVDDRTFDQLIEAAISVGIAREELIRLL